METDLWLTQSMCMERTSNSSNIKLVFARFKLDDCARSYDVSLHSHLKKIEKKIKVKFVFTCLNVTIGNYIVYA